MLPGMTDRSKIGVDEDGLASLLEMAYRRQVAHRRVTYVPNKLTNGAIRKLAHFLTDREDITESLCCTAEIGTTL